MALTDKVVIASWGGGSNSTAMLIGLRDRDQKPDLILFADTGGEKPTTYAFISIMQAWLEKQGFPPIVIVKNDGKYNSLEDNCLKKNMLPSLAYGFKSCSDKYKRRPQEKYAKVWPPAVKAWESGQKVTKLLGIDAEESHRAKIPEDKLYNYEYPLIEWDWGRGECIAKIKAEGLAQPGKSACFFCPASKKLEIRDLRRDHPDLFERALAMERNADLKTVKGLGRYFSWEQYIKADEAEARLFPEMKDVSCMCLDG